MSRLICIDSDWHSHLWPAFARPLPGGISTRLMDNLNARRQVLEFCRKHKPIARITNGDEFHTPGLTGTLDVPVLHAVIRMEEAFPNAGIVCYKNIGNHDQSDRSSESSAVTALSKLSVVSQSELGGFVETRDCVIALIPYNRDPQMIMRALQTTPPRTAKVPILWFVHYELDGVPVETGWRTKSPLTLDQLPSKDRVFFGHHHLHADYSASQKGQKRVVIIGSPLQHTFTDEGVRKGFLVYDLDKDRVEQIPITAPQFITLTWSKVRKGLPKDGNFYRITGVPATAAPDLRAAGVITEVIDETPETPRQKLQVTVTDLRGAVKKYVKAGLLPKDADPGEVEQYSLDVLDRCLSGVNEPIDGSDA